MNSTASNSKVAQLGGTIAGIVAGLLCWHIIFQPQLPPLSHAAQRTNAPPSARGMALALRAEVRRLLPAPSDAAREAVKEGRFVMEITHPDEQRFVSILMHRGGLVLAEQQGHLFVLGRGTRTPAGEAGIAWKDYSLQRVWRIAASDSVLALGLPTFPGDRLCLVMPTSWEMALACALETALPEPVTSYSKAHLRAVETAGGHLSLTLLSADHRERGTHPFNHTISAI